MKKKLIFNAFYSENNTAKIVGIGKNEKHKNSYEFYLKNIFVSLKSAKENNQDVDVMLITNNKLPEKYNKYFEENGIKILRVPFTHFLMPSQFVWSNAFYKLNALNYVINNLEYDYYLELDTDTYVPRNLNDLWSECEYDNLLLYNTKHKASHPVRKAIMEDYEKIFRKKSNVQQWGGEFICGNKQVLKLFLDKLQEVYNSIATAGFNVDTNSGDEMLISIAAKSMNILDSGAYIERYWTQRFYLSSTNWANDYVLIWHLPAEKNME